MRNAISGAWVLMIMITFMVVLIGYVTIQINYSKVYRLKTDVLTIIEKDDGYNAYSIKDINDAISAAGYNNFGKCTLNSNKVVGVRKMDTVPDDVVEDEYYQYCIIRSNVPGQSQFAGKYYYTVQLYFGFNLPMLGQLYTFKVEGQTNEINYPVDKYFE